MLEPWKVLGSRVIFSDHWLTLRTDRCQTSRGLILETFHIVELVDWLHVVAITRDLKVITLREYRHGAGHVVRGLPAGMMEKSDASSTEGARREIEEETGHDGGHFFVTGAAYANPAIQTNRVHAFLAIGLEPGTERRLDPSEDIELEFTPWKDFVRALLAGALEFHCLHLSGVNDALMFILRSREPEFAELRQQALEVLSGTTS